MSMLKCKQWVLLLATVLTVMSVCALEQSAYAADAKKPNIIFIMGDDVGWFNIGAYHQGIMAGKTPNLDRLAAEGMRFTDYYAEASCTAGRANFITGRTAYPHRPDDGGAGRRPIWHTRRRRRPSPRRSSRWATPPASLARTIWAI